jgi:hypothetical protein
LSSFILLIPPINSILRHLIWIVSEIATLYLIDHKVKTRFSCLLSRLLDNWVSHDTILIHQIAQKLRT